LLRSAVEGDTAWAEWYWFGTHRDGTQFGMRGVSIAEWYWFGTHRDGTQFGMRGVSIVGVQADQIKWARLYMEPVSASSE